MYRFLCIALLLLPQLSCSAQEPFKDSLPSPEWGLHFEGNGRDSLATPLFQAFNFSIPQPDSIIRGAQLAEGLRQQALYLARKEAAESRPYANLDIRFGDLQRTVRALQDWQAQEGRPLRDFVEAYQLQGEDFCGNVQFTSYYIPILEVRRQPDSIFRYPFYRKPNLQEYPDRKAIERDSALANQGLELAWAADRILAFFAHIQGSCFVRFEDGSQRLLAYGGSNEKKYRNLGRFLVERGEIDEEKLCMDSVVQYLRRHPKQVDSLLWLNPSFIFFDWSPPQVRGAANVPLSPLHSIAVDRTKLPLGACFLGKVPVLDEKGHCVRHEWRILLAQDTGSAIRGQGHVDWFAGIGEAAQQLASPMHHYGKLWLLLPKKAAP